MTASAAESVAPSTVFSANFKAYFEWLFLPDAETETAWNEKQETILKCLNGDESGMVDLWDLRELALQPGGLLCPTLRKRAWPKLLSCHEEVWKGATGALQHNPVTVSPNDLERILFDVSRTIWNVEEHVAASRKQAKIQEDKLQSFIDRQRREKRVSFAPTMVIASPRNQPPETIATSPTSEIDDGDDASVLSGDDIGTFSPATVATQESMFSVSSRVVRWRKASKQEQKILYNVIASLLRTEAPASPFFEDDRYHYYSGLQDLTALLMINLESPSISNIVLGKLAPSHLRDALRGDSTCLEGACSICFMPLLAWVDPSLHQHLQAAGITLPTFAKKWIACWFAQDIPDAQLASRLIDAFLVSHPLMPLYVSVAMLTANRDMLLNCPPHLSSLYNLIRGLPMRSLIKDASDSKGVAMAHLEHILSTAISYMNRIPPKHLVELGMNQCETSKMSSLVPTIAILQDPPIWATITLAPTDYAVVQRAKQLRQAETKESDCVSADLPVHKTGNVKTHPLALAALGRSHKQRSLKFLYVALLFAAALAVLCVAPTFHIAIGTNFTSFEKNPEPLLFLPKVEKSRRFSKTPLQMSTLTMKMKPKKKESLEVGNPSSTTALERTATLTANDESSKENTDAMGSSNHTLFSFLRMTICKMFRRLFWRKHK